MKREAAPPWAFALVAGLFATILLAPVRIEGFCADSSIPELSYCTQTLLSTVGIPSTWLLWAIATPIAAAATWWLTRRR
ncbi:hypothetical protein [Desertivibrio insolitus]|uniref:hypothetical protein n=1 Tax=Herbiconiux sp. SYSU D00978 TaxID=2812562 RepID=UPI001A96B90F|nr:hypothetical protein [Herbiconiux sp. SYSU D00978]